MTKQGLGIDGGGSATRWALSDESGVLVSGVVPAVSGHLFQDAEIARFASVAAELAAAVAPWRSGGLRVMAGITGLSAGSHPAAAAASLLGAALGIDSACVAVEDDIFIAYHAVFAPGEGHVVYSGTGSVGIHLRADGGVVRVGGRGYLIDDGGSAYWIGRTAIDRLYRIIDQGTDAPPSQIERHVAGALRDGVAPEAAAAVPGGNRLDWQEVRAAIYGVPRERARDTVAQLARAVALAAGDGDPLALGVLADAGHELARLACALARRVGERPIVLTGRGAQLHPAIVAAMQESCGLPVRLTAIDAAAAAARLAAA